MHTSTIAGLILALSASLVDAFPSKMGQLVAENIAKREINERQSVAAPQGAGFLPATPPPFDAKAQYISNKGQYAFVAPKSTDSRGECPGLNAMANHGYLPHNGVATIAQFINATNYVFGMALDLGTFLSVYGAVVDGSGTSWALEGGPHVGIGGSHNNYEGDSGPFKGDLFQYGSNSALVIKQFKEFYALQPDASTANYNLEVLTNFRGTRFKQSVSGNPLFVYNAFAGMQVSQAAFTFIYRFMSNKSAEYPEGILNKNVLKAFNSIYGPEDNLYWVPGYERIPDNWYTRNAADQYSIPYFEADILAIAATQPEILTTGCNQGVVNSYDVIAPETISGGAYTAADVAANPFCFSLESAKYGAESLLGLSSSQISTLTSALAPIESSMSCKPFTNGGNFTALVACPGFTLYGGPLAPVAKGSIQNQ